MTIHFTKEELKWIKLSNSKSYGIKCKEDAPKNIKLSVNRKIENHKKWLRGD